ncbi:hypothetical protein [Clostridium sp.]|uniref:hypothetical protein n=1 Tax=Clostridium sp. TaxID=1506 RepID=UPI001A4F0CDA|nr:hypothetical protein [Clostridium sp.]MBK5239810.1 hypothetical protein [Clostridium sp.]
MAKNTDKAIEVFSASVRSKEVDKVEIAEAREVMQKLAQNPTPQNRYEIASIVAYTVEDIVNQQTQFLDLFADVKRVSPNEKAKFDVKLKGIQAFFCAKGSTVERSRIYRKSVTLDTEAIGARPSVSFMDLAQGKVQFDEIVGDASYEMTNKIVGKVQSVLATGLGAMSTPNYGSGAGVIKATLDAQILAFRRLGMSVSLVGDYAVIAKLAALTGFTAVTGTLQFDPSIINEQNQNGFIGTYNGCSVIQLVNPFENGSFSSTILMPSMLYIVPSGAASMRPLKVAIESDIPPMDAINIDDRSYEMRLDKHFGSGLVFGDRAYMGAYKDTSL